MPSGWEVYYIVFFAALLSLGIPAGLSLLSKIFSKKPQASQPLEFRQKKEPANTSRSFNSRFFLPANTAVVLSALMLILIPCIGVIRNGAKKEDIFLGFIAVVSVAGFAVAGLLYSVRKGDLSWIKTFQPTDRAGRPGPGPKPKPKPKEER